MTTTVNPSIPVSALYLPEAIAGDVGMFGFDGCVV